MVGKPKRVKRPEILVEIIEALVKLAVQGDEGEFARCAVCGAFSECGPLVHKQECKLGPWILWLRGLRIMNVEE